MQHMKSKLKVTYLWNRLKNYFTNNENQAYHARKADAILACTMRHKNIKSAGVFSLVCQLKLTPVFQMHTLGKYLIVYLNKYGNTFYCI
jgi:hypothetical protein